MSNTSEEVIAQEPVTVSFVVIDAGGHRAVHDDIHYVQVNDGVLWLMGHARSIIHVYAPGAWTQMLPLPGPE